MAETYIFTGRSGCGKGTQAALLIDYLKKSNPAEAVFYLETGKFFREWAAGASPSAQYARAAMDKGGLMPSFLAIWNWGRYLVGDNFTGQETLIIDGAPRTIIEAEAIDTIWNFYKRPPAKIIYLDVEDHHSTTRLLARGRVDDTPAGIANRLAYFARDVAPVIDYYKSGRSPSQLLDIDGTGTIEEVYKNVINSIHG